MQSSRGLTGSPPPPPSSSSRFPWFGAGLALLATVVLVSGAPLVPEPHEFASTQYYKSPSPAHEAAARAADIRALFADPTAPWIPDARERSGGWIAHWLGGGEGVLSITIDGGNITLPHRPAAFPDWLGPTAQLPVSGVLRPFVVLPPPKSQDEGKGKEAPERACVAPAWPPIRPAYPLPPYTVALVERGGCDFATKVLAAQERGAAAVVVGDSVAHPGETDEEGRARENLITMFSPEDTSGIIIPSVFVSRASYLILRDLLSNHTIKGKPGIRVEVGEASDDGSLLTFALLMPSLFLIATVAAHRVRVARQREANRAPPTVVLSLPERVWGPDIVWEKDDSESDKDEASPRGDDVAKPQPKPAVSAESATDGAPETTDNTETHAVQGDSDVTTRSADADDEADADTATAVNTQPPRRRGKERRKSKRYYSKDECAICMDNFHKGEIVRILPCGHVFHKDECDEWLLKWRKLCPTCRADVTIPTTDLSGSTTITPVVERNTAPEGGVGYGATDDDGEGGVGARGTWSQRAGARLGAMWGSLRAAVARPAQETGERAPLVPANVV